MTRDATLAACGHPIVLFSSLLILVNDVVLRAVIPGWWTGKLSDAGFVVVAPIVLAALARLAGLGAVPARRLGMVITALVYTTLQLWPPFGAFFSESHIADVGDLVVLPAMLLSLLVWRRPARLRIPLAAALPFSGFALVATSWNEPPPAASWPCGTGMEWPTAEPLRFRLQTIDPIAPDAPGFVAGIRLSDSEGATIRVWVATAHTAPEFAICAIAGLQPNAAYTLQLGPWVGVESNEIYVEHPSLPVVHFVTDSTAGAPVASAARCGTRAGPLGTFGETCDTVKDWQDTGSGRDSGPTDTGNLSWFAP